MRWTFDRGTLLLQELPPEVDPSALPGVLWDARVSAFRAPAYRATELRAALERAGVSPGPAPTRPAPPARVQLELRPYQAAALAAWEAAGRRGVVALPTGSGKTRVGVSAIAGLGRATLVLVPTRVLLGTWCRALREVFGPVVGVLGDGERSITPLTVATFESAYRWMPRLGDRFELLVIDEAHHFGRGQRDEALELSTAPARLGLSATPPGEGELGLRRRLEELIGPTVYRRSLSDLAGRYLAPFEVHTVGCALSPQEREAYDVARRRFQAVFRPFRRVQPGASWAEFVRAARQSEAGRDGLRAWRRARGILAYPRAKAAMVGLLLARHADARVIVFTADNDAAYRIAREHLVMPLTCDIGRSERDEVLARFAAGEVRALVSSRVLNEGVDVPEAEVALVVGGAGGAREHIQRVGRVLRPRPGKRARVYELVVPDTHETDQSARRRDALVGRSGR